MYILFYSILFYSILLDYQSLYGHEKKTSLAYRYMYMCACTGTRVTIFMYMLLLLSTCRDCGVDLIRANTTVR